MASGVPASDIYGARLRGVDGEPAVGRRPREVSAALDRLCYGRQ
jgi:hypothetical protein